MNDKLKDLSLAELAVYEVEIERLNEMQHPKHVKQDVLEAYAISTAIRVCKTSVFKCMERYVELLNKAK